ncbi:MAG: hypothetical protein JW904_13195 [Spirochaetales bacterium]|nr:hypothetical protein [Spirochaetales bacterium]
MKDRSAFLLTFAFFLLAPVLLNANIIVKNGLTHENEAASGEYYEGSLELQNDADIPQEVKIYQADYFFYADGRILYTDPGKLERSNAHWITFSPKRLTIPPKEEISVRFSVKVPADKMLSGSYWSVFMVEGIPDESPESTKFKPQESGLGVRQVFRYAIQIVTQIGAVGKKSVQFQETKLLKQGVEQFLRLDIKNNGKWWLRATVWAELYDQNGNFVGKYEAAPLRLYPETSGRFAIPLSDVPNNTYKALIIVDCGGEDIYGANLNLIIK